MLFDAELVFFSLIKLLFEEDQFWGIENSPSHFICSLCTPKQHTVSWKPIFSIRNILYCCFWRTGDGCRQFQRPHLVSVAYWSGRLKWPHKKLFIPLLRCHNAEITGFQSDPFQCCRGLVQVVPPSQLLLETLNLIGNTQNNQWMHLEPAIQLITINIGDSQENRGKSTELPLMLMNIP